MPATKRFDLYLALAKARRRIPWLLKRLQAEGVNIGETKLRGWVKGNENYQRPTAEEWRTLRRVLGR